MTLIELGQSPGDFTFEMQNGKGKFTLRMNIIEADLASKAHGVEVTGKMTGESISAIAKAVRPVVHLDPADSELGDSALVAKFFEATELYAKAGKEPEPSPT